jgi:signal transduction histidine kinase
VLLLGAMATAFLRRSLYVRDFRLAFVLAGLVPVLSVSGLAPTSASSSIVRWALAMLLFGLLSWTLGMPLSRRSMILARPGRKQLVLPTIPLVALGALLTITLVRGDELQGTVLPWSMLLVSVAMAFRTAAAARESRHLLGLERDQLLASLSHEIRTPLTAVAGFSHVLSTSWDVVEDVERQELIELIGSEAESLVDIIGDMNALVRSELDAASLELERIQGKHLIAEAIKLVFRLDGQLPVRAEVEPYLELVCDRRRMVQVLRALFENAVRYGDGKILVVAKRTKTGRVIEVHDNGSGVERRHENTIWKRFERGEHELNANVPGSGLGLAVVRSIARAHQGDARYRRSERLGGACFSIELPYDSDVEHRRPGR